MQTEVLEPGPFLSGLCQVAFGPEGRFQLSWPVSTSLSAAHPMQDATPDRSDIFPLIL